VRNDESLLHIGDLKEGYKWEGQEVGQKGCGHTSRIKKKKEEGNDITDVNLGRTPKSIEHVRGVKRNDKGKELFLWSGANQGGGGACIERKAFSRRRQGDTHLDTPKGIKEISYGVERPCAKNTGASE